MSTNKFSPYAPIRYQDEVWWDFALQAGRNGYVSPTGQIKRTLPEVILNQLISPMISAGAAMAREEGNEEVLGQLFAKLMEQRHWVPMVAQYQLNGRQIFDLDDALVPLLAHTDVSDCNLVDWHPPYDAFFVRFGKQEDMRLAFDEGYEYLDGAFVAVTPWDGVSQARRLKFGLTTVKADGSGVMMPGYFVDFTPDEQALSPAAAVDSFIARKHAELDADQDRSENNLNFIAIRKGELNEGADLLRKAISLVVNCLFYIESIGSKREPSPGRDVPPDLLANWLRAPALRKFKAAQKINSAGYTMVELVGDEVHSGNGSPQGERAQVNAFWRKGHWRQQAHGPQHSLRKRIWIRPAMVNASNAQGELPGHVYVVASPGQPLQ